MISSEYDPEAARARARAGLKTISSFSNPVRMNHAYNLLNLHS
ncbi:hypothetical protein [Bordetella pertussis]|nr:hypothetical protein [Bordetella pertussis]ETH07458.1 hypothetical protein L571_0331 [Bordetella pertussis 2371640]